MRTVLAALDASPAARAVLETALGIAELMGADVEAVHVGRQPTETLQTLAARHDVPLRLLPPPTERALLGAVAAPPVVAALAVMQRTSKATVVVPPDAVGVSPRPFRRLLVSLEGSEESSRPVVDCLCTLIVTKVELVVLHVHPRDGPPGPRPTRTRPRAAR